MTEAFQAGSDCVEERDDVEARVGLGEEWWDDIDPVDNLRRTIFFGCSTESTR